MGSLEKVGDLRGQRSTVGMCCHTPGRSSILRRLGMEWHQAEEASKSLLILDTIAWGLRQAGRRLWRDKLCAGVSTSRPEQME